MKRVAICNNPFQKKHSTLWNTPWIEHCKEDNIPFETINPYALEIMDKLKNFDILLWHYSGYSITDMIFARSILYAAKEMGLIVFPDFEESWHFDDKVAQTYLLKAINAPIPKSFLFYSLSDTIKFLEKSPNFPMVAKLRNGSGAHNVKMINSAKELRNYAKLMFSRGLSSTPNIMYKTTSNIKSTLSLKMFIQRSKRIPEFLRTWRTSKQFAKEKGYVYLQSFVPNDGYDIKVAVVGDKLSFIGRQTRKGDFRASGGGALFYDKSIISKRLIDVAFTTNDSLNVQCMGYDFVINRETNEPIIIEMSYGFSHQALKDANGFFDRKGNWHDSPLDVPKEVLKILYELKN